MVVCTNCRNRLCILDISQIFFIFSGVLASLNGKIYGIGGSTRAIYSLNTVEVYSIANDSWSSSCSMIDRRKRMGKFSALHKNGRFHHLKH